MQRESSQYPDFSCTYASDPALWDDGPSFLGKIKYTDGCQAVFASGWHRRQIEFENPGVVFADAGEVGVIELPSSTHPRVHPSPEPGHQSIDRYEIEVSFDEIHANDLLGLLARFIPESDAHKILDSMSDMVQRVSANRANKTIEGSGGQDIHTVDLLCQNLPARSGNATEPLRAISRWCRIFELERGTVTIYQAMDETEKAKLRWPHNAIWLNRGKDYYLQPSDSIGDIVETFKIPVQYERYNLANWRIEFDFWENQPFQVMVTDDADVASARLAAALKELAILSEFITVAFLSTRNLQRRLDNNELIRRHKAIRDYAKKQLEELQSEIVEYRILLEKASTLLANTAQSVQAVANRETAEAAEKTNTFLNFATTVFFIPTLIISFYSMSIIGQNQDEPVPTTTAVLILCIISVALGIASLTIFRFAQKRKRKRAKQMFYQEVKQ